MNAGTDSMDPISEWFTRNIVQKPDLKYALEVVLPDGTVRIRTNSDVCLSFLHERCSQMMGDPSKGQASIDVEMFCLADSTLPGVSPCGQPVTYDGDFQSIRDSHMICVWQSPTLMGATDGTTIRVLATALNPQISGCLVGGFRLKCATKVEPPYSDVLDLVWCLYARMFNLVLLHGAVLEKDGQGVLIVGESGTGKTTTALALLRAGFRLLSDEYAVLRKNETGQGEMSGLLVPPMIVGSGLHALSELEQTLGIRSTQKTPAVGVITSHAPSAVNVRTVIVLKRPKRRRVNHQASPFASLELLPLLMGQVLDPVRSDRMGIVEALSKLVLGVSAYHVIAGRDVGSLPAFVEDLMDEKGGH